MTHSCFHYLLLAFVIVLPAHAANIVIMTVVDPDNYDAPNTMPSTAPVSTAQVIAGSDTRRCRGGGSA